VRNKAEHNQQNSLAVPADQSEHHVTQKTSATQEPKRMNTKAAATETKNAPAQRLDTGCPACGHKVVRPTDLARVFTCAKCDAVFGDCYLGDSYGFVLPFMIATEPHAGEMRYYDFTCLGSKGVTRRHGWYDPATKLIVQVG
jgi:hypothetical protein